MNTLNITRTDHVRHYLNPLHVFCRLRRVIGSRLARIVAQWYELHIYNFVQGG